MRTDLFDFELPPERIALRPVSPRDAARLLVVRPGGAPELEDKGVRDMPELPYIAGKRKPDEQDRADYQTMFAHDEGSVAAPTAGLHFTGDLLARLAERGVAV